MSRRSTIKKFVLLAAASLGAVAGTITPARATLDPPFGALQCDANDPLRPANGEIVGYGVAEQKVLQDALYIPDHEARCAQTVGKISFEHTSDAVAIDNLQKRWVTSGNYWHPTPYIGLNQPLSTEDYAKAVNSTNQPGLLIGAGTLIYHLPMMIDGFVVTADVPCPTPAGSSLKLTPDSLSAIYTGVATGWGDAALLVDNPWLLGCTAPIAVSARVDAAWSNHVLKDYMSKRNPLFEHYKQRNFLSSWPATLSIDCAANSDADMVSCASNAGSISYMRYATAKANGLTPALVTNGDGATPPPALNATDTWPSACPAAAVRNDLPGQLMTNVPAAYTRDWSTYSMTYGKSYPLCAFSYVVVPSTMPTGTSMMEWDARRDHLKIMWSDTSQDALKDYGYAPLPPTVLNAVRFSDPMF